MNRGVEVRDGQGSPTARDLGEKVAAAVGPEKKETKEKEKREEEKR